MSETFYFEIPALCKNNVPLSSASCTFILGHYTIDSPIPTPEPIQIRTENINENETLLILFKHQDNLVAKTSKPLSLLKLSSNLNTTLDTLNAEENGNGKIRYSWDPFYSVIKEAPHQFQDSSKNPFHGNLMKSPEHKQTAESKGRASPEKLNLSKTSEQGLASFDAGAKGFSPVKIQDSPTKVKIDYYLGALEEKLKKSAKESEAVPEISQLLSSIKTSVNELERSKYGDTNFNQLLPSNHGGSEHNLENYSPKFGKNQFMHFLNDAQANGGKGHADEIKMTPGEHGNEGRESGELEDIEERKGDDEEIEHDEDDGNREIVEEAEDEREEDDEDEDEEEILNEMERANLGDERDIMEGNSFPKSVDTHGSLHEEIQIDRNQEFLQEIKSQLSVKVLSNLADGFTRELVMQMSRSKKKVVAIRLKKSVKLRTKEEILIDTKNFFREGCDRKCLHYFQPFTKYLFLFNLVKPFDVIQERSQVITLDINFDISPHAKSVVTPSGLIFLVSGKSEPSASDLDDSTGSLHVYNVNGQTLIEKTSMTASRKKNFGLCYMSKNLFVVGGIVNGILSNYCERYDIRSNEWFEVAPMNKKLKDITMCGFNNRYIYRFFGVNANGLVDKSIERYDAVRDKWVMMNVLIPEGLNNIHMPLCTQINEDHIFIFGGRTSSGFPSKASVGHVMRIEDKRRSTGAEIVQTKNFVSGLAGGFSQNSMIAHCGDILFLRESY